MAKVGKNIVTTGLSGKLGDLLVFRVRGDKTIVSQAPTPSNLPPTEAQVTHRKKFQKATLYAKSALATTSGKETYETGVKPGVSAYNVAVADFMQAPHIDEIDMSGYTGQAGTTIKILPVDDFQVAEVAVSIANADGTLIENGQAIQEEGSMYWIYTATTTNESIEGDKITVIASDIPGNETTEQKDI